MIEVIERSRCISCDLCIEVCPTRVFDTDADGIPVIARPVPGDSRFRDVGGLTAAGLLGGYRRELGWGQGRALGARTAIGPEYPG
jgi:ferredoxin